MKCFISKLFKEEKGQGMTEYGMIIGYIAVAAIIVMIMFREEIADLFTDATTEMEGREFEME